jgi:hypothetical protein
MAITINAGPMGRGGARIEHPKCVVDGIQYIISHDLDGNCLDHK